MTYDEKLESTKAYYPFAKWEKSFFPAPGNDEIGRLEQYTEENCNAAKSIFDKLITSLKNKGESALENEKVNYFEIAILELNDLDEEVGDLIETGECEELCELIDQITIAAGLNPKNYAEGAGLADEWRNW